MTKRPRWPATIPVLATLDMLDTGDEAHRIHLPPERSGDVRALTGEELCTVAV